MLRILWNYIIQAMKASPADSGSNFFFFYKSIYSDIYQKNTSWRGGEINSRVLRFTADRNSFLKRIEKRIPAVSGLHKYKV